MLILSITPGPSGGNAYSPTTTAFTVPMPGETVEVTIQDASWMVVGMQVAPMEINLAQTVGVAHPQEVYILSVPGIR